MSIFYVFPQKMILSPLCCGTWTSPPPSLPSCFRWVTQTHPSARPPPVLASSDYLPQTGLPASTPPWQAQIPELEDDASERQLSVTWSVVIHANSTAWYEILRLPSSYLSSLLSTWKVRSMTVVHCRQRMTNVLGRGLSVFINWHSVKYTTQTDV